MRELILGGLAVAAVGGGVFYGPDLLNGEASSPNGSYAISEAEAITRMMAAKAPADKPPFFAIAVKASNLGGGVIEWSGAGSHAVIKCQAKVSVMSEGRVNVTPSCLGGSPSDGAAGGISSDMISLGFAEFVAAGLEQRPMDMRKWAAQSMGAVMKGLPSAKQQALAMDAAVKQMEDSGDFSEKDSFNEPGVSDFGSFSEAKESY